MVPQAERETGKPVRAKRLRALGAIVSVGCIALVGCSGGSEAPMVTGALSPSTTLVGLTTETMEDVTATSSNVEESLVEVAGDALFYRSATNEFAVLTKDNVLRTYFKPYDDLQYWLNQIGGG